MLQDKLTVANVTNGQEFNLLKIISDYYKIDYNHLIDFNLDLYNYQRRCGLDNIGAKIMAFNNTADYAYTLYRRDLKCGKKY